MPGNNHLAVVAGALANVRRPRVAPWSSTFGGGLLIAITLAGCGAGDGRTQDGARETSTEAAAMRTVTSRDGTRIAYDRVGNGPPVILVNGALAGRAAGAELAKLLAERFTVYTFDRRGRGDSGDTRPYALGREIEDIAALIAEAGGTAHLVGFSSGAALALETASALGPQVAKLAIYEAPYDEAAGAAGRWKTYRAEQAALLAAGRRGDAVLHHLRFVGMPDAAVAELQASPAWAGMEAMAPTLPYDVAAIGDDRSVPVARAGRIRAKALVLDGGASREAMPFMRASADRIAQAIPEARRRTIEGQGHNVAPQAIAPVLIDFFSAP
jgi:pimeloyl-ACP methyl ester carboxylesterase